MIYEYLGVKYVCEYVHKPPTARCKTDRLHVKSIRTLDGKEAELPRMVQWHIAKVCHYLAWGMTPPPPLLLPRHREGGRVAGSGGSHPECTA